MENGEQASNPIRAARGHAALDTYTTTVYGSPAAGLHPGDQRDALCDLLVDLMHFADADDELDFDDAHELACMHHRAEATGEEE